MIIRLVTFHTPKNYGALLQAFSLMKFLQTLGEDVKIIDYKTDHLESMYALIQRKEGFKGLVKTILQLPSLNKRKKRHSKFDSFVKSALSLSKRYAFSSDLYHEFWEPNTIFITGSDQVFSPTRQNDERAVFFLDFVPDNCYKFSYAASFGKTEIPNEYFDIVKKYLSRMNEISVREESGIEIINAMDLDCTPCCVMDPVFLHDRFFWEQYCMEYPLKKDNTRFILYYRLMNSTESDDCARRFADRMNLQLIVITDGLFFPKKRELVLRDVGPKEFLYLYKKASFIASNSFHGVVFSLIFQKQFVFTDFDSNTNSRGIELLTKLGLNPKPGYYCNNCWVDYSVVSERVSSLVDGSKKFIVNALCKADKHNHNMFH